MRRAQRLGLTLDSIRDILAVHDAGDRPCRAVGALAQRRMVDIDRQIAELRLLRDDLARLAVRTAEVGGPEAGGPHVICPGVEGERPEGR